MSPKGPLQCKCLQRFGHTQRNFGYAPRCVACGGTHLSGGCFTSWEQPHCCDCGGNHTGNYRGCVKWKEARAALEKQAPFRSRKSVGRGQTSAPKAQRARPSAERMELGEGLNHVVRGGRVDKASTTPTDNPHLKQSRQQVTKAPKQPKVTSTRETARPQKPVPKSTAAPKRSAGKSHKDEASVKAAAAKTTHRNLMVPNQTSTFPLEEISDLLDHLPPMLVWN